MDTEIVSSVDIHAPPEIYQGDEIRFTVEVHTRDNRRLPWAYREIKVHAYGNDRNDERKIHGTGELVGGEVEIYLGLMPEKDVTILIDVIGQDYGPSLSFTYNWVKLMKGKRVKIKAITETEDGDNGGVNGNEMSDKSIVAVFIAGVATLIGVVTLRLRRSTD